MFTTIQEGIQAIQKQVLSDTPPEHALYIPAQGKRTTYATEDAFDLHQAVSEFLKFPALNIIDQKDSKDQKTPVVDNGRKVLLLLGDTGSGKSLFCQDLITRLWQSYKPGNPIPLFISLARLQDPIGNVIEETLISYGFSAEQIATLKKEQQFIFVLDGYDEIHQFKNLYVTNKLNEWQARTIITCRSQYLYYLNDTDKHFMPFHGEKRQPQLLQQFYVAPFSEKEIVAYLQQYEKLNGQAVVADLKDQKYDMKSAEIPKPVLYQQLISIPGLQILITTPFLLHLAVEALPDILVKYNDSKDQKNTEQQKLTQAALYDVFIERWFKRQELKLKTSKHIDEKAADPKPNFWKFCKDLAVTMRTQNVTLINYTPEKISKLASAAVQNKLNPWKKFFSEDQEIELLRSACPIRKLGPNQYGFIHASLIEYFATRAMYEEVVAQPSQQIVISAVAVSDTKDSKQAIMITYAKMQSGRQTNLLPLSQSTLYQSSITKQNNMIQFLADRVQESEVFKKKLFEVIELSKKDERYAVCAANSITVLARARTAFSDIDFRGIRIPGANISYGILDNTQLQGADLTGVNLTGAWLRQANASGANLKDIELGELPFFPSSSAQVCCYSSDGRWLALASGRVITIYDANSYQKRLTLPGTEGIITCMTFSPDGGSLAAGSQLLLKGSDINKIYLFSVETGAILISLLGHVKRIQSIAFSPDGQLLVSAADDATVQLRDLRSQNVLKTYQYTESCRADFSRAGCLLVARIHNSNAVGIDQHDVQVFEPSTNKLLQTLKGHTAKINVVAFSHDGCFLATGSRDNTIKLWSIASGALLHTLTGHAKQIKALAFSSDDRLLASGSSDTTIRVWETESGKLQLALEGHEGKVQCVAFQHGTSVLVSGSGDGVPLEMPTEDVLKLVARNIDDSIRFWKIDSQNKLQSQQVGSVVAITRTVFSADGQWLISGDSEGVVRRWSTATGALRQIFTSGKAAIENLAFSADENSVFVSTVDNVTQQWNIQSGKLQRTFPYGLKNISATDFTGDCLTSSAIAFGQDSKLVAFGSWEDVQLQTTAGIKQSSFKGHTRRVTSVAMSLDGELLASASEDKTVRLWSITSGQCLVVIKGFKGEVLSVSLIKNKLGLFLATGSRDSTIRYWQLHEENNTLRAILRWSSQQTALTVSDTNIQDATGLTNIQQQLFKQHATKEQKAPDELGGMKKFTVPCLFGEKNIQSPFTIYLGDPSTYISMPKRHAIYFQSKWLKEIQGGTVPEKILDSLERLRVLAEAEEISFKELCVFALNAFGKKDAYRLEDKRLHPPQFRPSTMEFLQQDISGNALASLYVKSKNYYEKDQDKVHHSYRLGVCYKYGYGVNKDEKQADVLFHSAAKKSEPLALRYLSAIYPQGKSGSIENTNNNLIAAALGDGHVYYNFLVAIEASAVYAEIIEKKLFPVYCARFAKGDGLAAVVVGLLTYLFDVNGVEKAKAIFEQAGKLGCAAGYYQLGIFYERGIGSSPNLLEAVKYYDIAAKMGHLYAMEKLGGLYSIGSSDYHYSPGVDLTKARLVVDGAKAARYYLLAADQGSCNAQANIAISYWSGQGVAVDWIKASEYTELHLAGVDPLIDDAKINFNLCAMLAAWCVEISKKYDLARDLYHLIIKEKLRINNELDYSAASGLAELYKNGWGVPVDHKKALQLCDDVINATFNTPAKAGLANYIKWQILSSSTNSQDMTRAKQAGVNAIKVYCHRVNDDPENIDAAANYRLGKIIRENRLNFNELQTLGLSAGANYYFTKATQVNKKYFYSHLYADLARQEILLIDEKSQPALRLDSKTEDNLANVRAVEPTLIKDWHLPLSNDHYFVGCKKELALLQQRFKSTENTQGFIPYVISGLAGIGKTELACYYSRHAEQPYVLRVWFCADSEARLLKDYREFAEQFNLIDEKVSDADVIYLVKGYLERTKNGLVIYDNAGSRKEIEKFIPQNGGHLIITTYRREWHEVAPSLTFDRFESGASLAKTEALALLSKTLPYDEKSPANSGEDKLRNALVEKLFFLPSALVQASSYIKKQGKKIEDYLALSEDEFVKVLNNDEFLVAHYNQSVFSAWLGSVVTILNNTPQENYKHSTYRVVLLCISILSPVNIPREILLRWLEIVTKSVTSAALLLDELLADLEAHSLIDVKNQMLSIHPLVQLLFRGLMLSNLTEQDKPVIMDCTFNLGICMMNEINGIMVAHSASPAYRQVMLLHVEVFIYYFDALLTMFSKNLSNQKVNGYREMQGHLLVTLGSFSMSQEAISYYRSALDIFQNCTPQNLAMMISLFCSLVQAQYAVDANEKKATRNILERALLYFEKALGTDYSDINQLCAKINQSFVSNMIESSSAVTVNTLLISRAPRRMYELANICMELNEYYTAKLLFECVLRIEEVIYGKNSWRLGDTLCELSLVYRNLRRDEKAIDYLERALALEMTNPMRQNHPDVGRILVNLTIVYFSQQKWLKAQAYAEQAQQIFVINFSDPQHQKRKDIEERLKSIARHLNLANLVQADILTALDKQNEKSVRQCFQDQKLDFDDPQVHEDLAWQYSEQKNLRGLIRHSELALKLLKDQKDQMVNLRRIAGLHHNLGCYYHSYAYEQQKTTVSHEQVVALLLRADDHFKQGIALVSHPGLHAEYGRYLLIQQRTVEAIPHLEKVLSLAKADARLTLLVYSEIERFTLDTTLQIELDFWQKIYTKAVVLAHYSLVIAYIKQNQLSEAQRIVKLFQQLAIQEKDPLTFSLLGHTQQMIKDHVGAVESYQLASRLEPGYSAVQQHLKQTIANNFKSTANSDPLDEKSISATTAYVVDRKRAESPRETPLLVIQNSLFNSTGICDTQSSVDKKPAAVLQPPSQEVMALFARASTKGIQMAPVVGNWSARFLTVSPTPTATASVSNNANNMVIPDSKVVVLSSTDSKVASSFASLSTPVHVVVQHSSIFSAPIRDTQPSSTVLSSDVKSDTQQQPVQIDNATTNKSKSDSGCTPCCSIM